MRIPSSTKPCASQVFGEQQCASLVVVLYGQAIGRLDRESGGGASFTYDPEYLARSSRPQLSMRLPLRKEPFPPARVLTFLDGLLPENREARRHKANATGVTDDPVSLLSVMGWDCPGAVQVSPPDQIEQMFAHRRATGRLPESKYEDRGGPTARDMAQVLRTHSSDPEPELRRLADFVLINYVAAAPDGHAKNVSIRILPDGDVQMAPLYDLASGLPYNRADIDRSLALAIGGQRRVDRIHASQWSRAARELGVPKDLLQERARHLLVGFPDAFHQALDEVGTPEAADVWEHSAQALAAHTSACLRQLDASRA